MHARIGRRRRHSANRRARCRVHQVHNVGFYLVHRHDREILFVVVVVFCCFFCTIIVLLLIFVIVTSLSSLTLIHCMLLLSCAAATSGHLSADSIILLGNVDPSLFFIVSHCMLRLLTIRTHAITSLSNQRHGSPPKKQLDARTCRRP